MRALLLTLCFSSLLFVVVTASDSTYVLVQARGLNGRDSVFNKGHMLEKQLILELKKQLKKKPVSFLLPEDISDGHSYNYSIVLNVLELHIDEPVINQLMKNFSQEVIANNYRDEAEDIRKVHAIVSADLTITERLVSGFIRLTVSTTQLPATSTVWEEIFTESFKWENNTATYSGSQQALGYKELELVRNKVKPIPTPEMVYEALVKHWTDKSSAKIANSLK